MHSQPPKWHKNQIIWHDTALIPELDARGFDGQWWKSKGELIGESKGRGTTYFFRHQQNEFVLRHYLRGGLIGKLLNDQYLYTGLKNTRAWQEKALLNHLQELGLPAPMPAAARVIKKGLVYRADLITVKIPYARDVHHILLEKALSDDVWQNIGATIARFHQHQVYHHDLNIHNIMLDESGKVWLIDFDKCAVKAGEDWKRKNLERLERSLEKENNQNVKYKYSISDFKSLLQGYSQP